MFRKKLSLIFFCIHRLLTEIFIL